MITEGRTTKFPLLEKIMDIPVEKKNIYLKQSSRLPVQSHTVTDKSVSLNYIYELLIRGIDSRHAV